MLVHIVASVPKNVPALMFDTWLMGGGCVSSAGLTFRFGGGVYEVGSLRGHVQFRLTNLSGPSSNAVASGLFFDATSAPPAPPARVSYAAAYYDAADRLTSSVLKCFGLLTLSSTSRSSARSAKSLIRPGAACSAKRLDAATRRSRRPRPAWLTCAVPACR